MLMLVLCLFFFFQAEDGIRDVAVTGVQTCALPIWHPHRGIETITYVLEGTVEHGDSMGNKGIIGPGDTQWMTAGSGIIHQEMPQPGPHGRMGGFQLWANLPASNKTMDPRYRAIKAAEVPVLEAPGGARIRAMCGTGSG